jgi:hypothetical protein
MSTPSGSDSGTAPNLLLVVLDTVTARHTSLCGAPEETTPGLRSLAAEATVYTQTRASSNWSLPSHATLFTGTPALRHRLTMDRRLVEGVTLFERLAAAGYATGVFSANPWLTSHPAGFGHAFETVVGTEAFDGDGDDTDDTDDAHGRSDTEPDGYWFAGRFLEWVREREGPWAACLNLMDAHFPYDVRPGHDAFGGPVAWSVHDGLPRRWEWDVYAGDLSRGVPRLLASLYRSGIRQADAVTTGVWEELVDDGVASETLLVVTSDHGECFGDPPAGPEEPLALEHGLGTHESLFHVPLLVKAPGQTEGRTVTALAGHTRLSSAVAAARRGTSVDPGWFVAPDGRVTAHQPPLHPRLVERARAVCPEPKRYEGAATVLYEDAADAVEKLAAYGDGAYAVTLPKGATTGAHHEGGAEVDPEAVRLSAEDAARRHREHEPLSKHEPVTTPRAGDGVAAGDDPLLCRDATDADRVTERLEDLGYL